MELRMQLDDEFARILMDKLNLRAASDMAKEGLTILNWAVQERERGRVILSATPDGQNVARLAMPVLEQIRPPIAAAAAQGGAPPVAGVAQAGG